MALPPKAIEQLGREPIRTPGWSGRVLMFTGTIFFFSLAINFGIRFGYMPYLNNRAQEVGDEITKFGQQVPEEKQRQLIVFYSQLSNLKELLKKQAFGSPVFPFLEQNTHRNVYFSKFTLELPQNKVVLSGSAKTLDDLSEQLILFQNQPEVASVVFGGATAGGDGLWGFNATLFFDGKFFRNRGAATNS